MVKNCVILALLHTSILFGQSSGFVQPATSTTRTGKDIVSAVAITVPSTLKSARRYQRQNKKSSSRLFASPPKRQMDKEEIKRQLTEYLEKRKEMNADEIAAQEKGKVIGGTKGNVMLDFLSVVPAKESVIDTVPNIFDYSELAKYGYSNLATPIMDIGGRRAAYELMDMEPPALAGPPPKRKAPELRIDRTGENDENRYSGLKMGQIMDDDAMGEALARANEKSKKGQSLRPKLIEEDFELPFADKVNTGPKQVPEWTVEKLDEYTASQSRAMKWANRAKLGEFVKDPDEILDLSLPFRIYFILSSLEVAFAFGRSSTLFLQDFIGIVDTNVQRSILDTMQAPGLALIVASVGSSIVCSFILAPSKNRSAFTWFVKGFVGGPLAVRRLRELEPLITFGEQAEQEREREKKEKTSST